MNIKAILVTSIATFYPSVILFLYSPWFGKENWTTKVIFFAIIFAIVYIAVRRFVSAERHYSAFKHFFETVILIIGNVSAALAFFAYILPTKEITTVAIAPISNFVALKSLSPSELSFTLLAVPLVAIIIAVRR